MKRPLVFDEKGFDDSTLKMSLSEVMQTNKNNEGLFLYLAWMTAALSTAGSFFFSHFMKLPPCDLCWYQRIFMFPLVILLAIGFSLKDPRIHYYSLPVIGFGWVIALYHNLLYYKWISASLSPCTSGLSCTEKQLDLFGFLSIPLMSFLSFSIILILILLHSRFFQTCKGRSNEKK